MQNDTSETKKQSQLQETFIQQPSFQSSQFYEIYSQLIQKIKKLTQTEKQQDIPISVWVFVKYIARRISEKKQQFNQNQNQVNSKSIFQIINNIDLNSLDKNSKLFYNQLTNSQETSELHQYFLEYFERNSQNIYTFSQELWKLLAVQAYHKQSFNKNKKIDWQLQNLSKIIKQKQKKLFHTQKSKNRTFIIPKFKYNCKIKDLNILRANTYLISIIDKCQAYVCPYLIFHIPFSFILAETLTFYQNPQCLYIYELFVSLIQKINRIKLSKNPQFPPQQLSDYVAFLVNFKKQNPETISKRLCLFLDKYGSKMATFIPVYYKFFSFCAKQKYNLIQQHSQTQCLKKIKERYDAIEKECQIYKSQNI